LGPAWSWDDLPFYYAAEISGLSYNEGTVELLVEATTPGQPTRITWEPAMTPYVRVENTSTTARAGTPYDEGYARDLSGNTIYVSSTIAEGRRDFEAVSVHNPTAYFAQVLLETLEAQGIAVEGQAFDADAYTDAPFDYARMTTLAAHESPTLAQIARDVNVRSNNLAAEHLFKTLGARIYPALPEAREDDAPEAGSFEAGALATRAFLGRAGVDTSRVRVRDGSGLSYQNLVRPADFAALLTYMDRHPEPGVRAAFFDSLPVGGRDGTLARRFRTGRAGGNVRAKTGFITGARSLVGVVTTAGGSRLGFVLLTNHYSARTRAVSATHDAIVELLAGWPR
ncbi:MAG: D-alanyl-D-alanine carboxypeptidase/D-alanyl-D-alanine-endopeptidase, partial [Bacteroidota bacterium]